MRFFRGFVLSLGHLIRPTRVSPISIPCSDGCDGLKKDPRYDTVQKYRGITVFIKHLKAQVGYNKVLSVGPRKCI